MSCETKWVWSCVAAVMSSANLALVVSVVSYKNGHLTVNHSLLKHIYTCMYVKHAV